MQETKALDRELDAAIEKDIGPIASSIEKETEKPENKLITPALRTQTIERELKEHINSFRKKCAVGMRHALEVLTELAMTDPEINLEKFNANLRAGFNTLDSMDTLEKLSLQVLQGSSWCDLLGFEANTITNLYKAAKFIFESTRYKEAEATFTLLTILEPFQSTFWIGLGHSQFELGMYDEALIAYDGAASSNPTSPWPFLYEANCYEARNDLPNALQAIENAGRLVHESPEGDQALEHTIHDKMVSIKNRL